MMNIIRVSLTSLLIIIFITLFTITGYASTDREEERIPCFMSDFSTIAIKDKDSNEDDVTVLEDGTEIVQYYNWDNTYIYFGNYEQDNDIQTKEEPILWRVVNKTDNQLVLVSDQSLDMKPFHNDTEDVSWEDCSLRAWLNGYNNNPWKDSFLERAFPDNARSFLQPDDRGDYVSILSVEEINEYITGARRVAINTEYVRNKGSIDYNGYSMWWTRTMAETSDKRMLCAGAVDYVGRSADNERYAVRPVIRLSFDDILFASAVEDGKALYSPGNQLSIVDRSTDQIYKLTFLDNQQTLDIETEDTIEAEQGQVFTFPYSNATTGYHNYISAILTYDNPKDASGESIVYYSKLQQARSEEGMVTLQLPEDINAGDYKMSLFNETCLTYDKYDYASKLHTVTLKIPMKTGGFFIQEIENQHYTGEEIEPTVVVKDADGNIVSPLEYRVVYENNVEAGTAYVRVLSKRKNYIYSCIDEREFQIVGKEVPLVLTCNAVYGDKIYPNHNFHVIARMEPQENKEPASGGRMEFYMNDEILNPGGTPVNYGYSIFELSDSQLNGYGKKSFYAKYIPAEVDIYGANESNKVTVLYKTNDSNEKLMSYIMYSIIGIVCLLVIIGIIMMIVYRKKTGQEV